MKKKTLWLLGGTAAGGLILWRYMSSKAPKPQSLSGLSGLGATSAEWTSIYTAANNLYSKLVESISPLPANLKSGYAATLYDSPGAIYSQLKLSYDHGTKGNYEPARLYADAAYKNLQRIAPLISADLANPTGMKSAAIVTQRLQTIAKTQEANEAERKLAEQGALTYVATKIGEGAGSIVGGAAKGATSLVTGFLKKIPWWVYVLGVGGGAAYFFGPALMARLAARIARPKPKPAPAPVPVPVQVNPRRKRSKRRR